MERNYTNNYCIFSSDLPRKISKSEFVRRVMEASIPVLKQDIVEMQLSKEEGTKFYNQELKKIEYGARIAYLSISNNAARDLTFLVGDILGFYHSILTSPIRAYQQIEKIIRNLAMDAMSLLVRLDLNKTKSLDNLEKRLFLD